MSPADGNVGTDPKLVSTDGSLNSAWAGPGFAQLENTTLPAFLPRQRWFGAKDQTIENVRLVSLGELEPGNHALLVADVRLDGETQRYLLPVSAIWEAVGETRAPVLARIGSGERSGVLIDSALHEGLALALLDAMRQDMHLDAEGGTVLFIGSDALRRYEPLEAPHALGVEQSNVSIAFGSSIILKLYRRLREGDQPDVEVARFLTGVGGFRNTPEFLGEVRFRPKDGSATTLAAAFAFVPNQGDAWAAVTGALALSLNEDSGDAGRWLGAVLGRRTAEMHQALAVHTDDIDFRVDPLQPSDSAGWVSEAVGETRDLLGRLERRLSALSPFARAIAEDILARQDRLIARIKACGAMAPSGGRSRIHGDYHLGQVLVTRDDVMIIDFEGEPKRSLAERRAKSSPLRDVAGMLRSFHYAAWTALDRYRDTTGDLPDTVRARVEDWRRTVTDDFLASYQTHVAGAASYPSDPAFARALTDLFVIQKAIYEVGYELANRPDWIQIPLSGIQDLLNEGQSPGQ
ncbi:putative maltokinase [Pelagibacterium montanilacus]|uniref:putative maltokinase n=1 Tax=Pelagibacterium montanilacus TaxID=2185280 RepID=UPI000F8E2764|nr:putative maltokinase [Pelagibacterium montanilacus]